MSFGKSLFITFFAAGMHWENHLLVRLLLAFHYWTVCIDDNVLQQPIQAFRTLQTRKAPNFMQQKTVFLDFYKTNDYFSDLIIKTKDLCTQCICSWETTEAYPQKCSLKRTNTFLGKLWWGTASGTLGNVLHYFSAISPFFQKQFPRCVLQKKWTPFDKNTFGWLLQELLK